MLRPVQPPTFPIDTAACAAFVARVTGGVVRTERALDLMENLVAGPEAVRVLGDPASPRALGVLVDTCANAADAAELNLFATRETRAEDTRTLVEWALALARRGPRSMMDVALYEGGADREALTGAGFASAYTLHSMRLDPLRDAVPGGPPPSGFEWRDLTPELVPALYETTCLAFADVPGAFLPDLEAYRARCALFPNALRSLLTDGVRVAAFVRCEVSGDAGEVLSLGRHPAFRGAGLGRLVLARGLELLLAAGARSATLEVAAVNQRALRVYDAAGFVRTGSLEIVRRSIIPDRALAGPAEGVQAE
jgi:ribosomal protein S18 acetylase RimI-like enzyme